jgi:hypothetical protein
MTAPRAITVSIATSTLLACGLMLGTGCSLLGTPASSPDGLPHAGVGPFRDLTTTENGLTRPGAAVLLRNVAGERPMQAGLHLFYAAASTEVPDAGVPDAGTDDAGADDGGVDGGALDAGEPLDAGPIDAGPEPEIPDDIDWDALAEGRRIYRSPPSEENWGFFPGTVVLAPEGGPAWEGGYVTDPWAVETADGALLYYAAEGGIGVAEASAIDGTFTRVGTAPILGLTGSDAPRCPAVVATEGLGFVPDLSQLDGGPVDPGEFLFESAAFYMVYELAGTIRIATSADGRAFTDRGAITIPAIGTRDVRDGAEVSVGCPGVGIAEPNTGRRFLRVYYESRRDNGAVLVGLMATSNGSWFDFHPTPVISAYDHRMPAPRMVDARISLLFSWRPRVAMDRQVGELMVGVAPGGARLEGATR